MAGLHYRLDWQVLDSYFQFAELSSAPATPEANSIRLYAKDNGSNVSTLCYKADNGGETCLPVAGSVIPTQTTVSANRLTYWASSSQLDDVPRTLTAGSVLFVHTDFLPQEDNTKFFWNDTDKQLLIGINSGTHFSTDTGLCLDEDGSSSIVGTTAHSATVTHAGGFNAQRSRGTHASQSIVAVDDRIMRIVAQAYDGSLYRDAASIDAYVDATPGSGDMPGRLVFNTTPDGSTVLAEAFRITSGQRLAAGTTITAAPVYTLHIADNTATSGIFLDALNQTGNGSIIGRGSRGTFASPTATQTDDTMLLLGARGRGATAYSSAVKIAISERASEIWTDSAQGTYFSFFTTNTGGLTLSEKFRIGPAGQWGIGGATFGTAGQVFTSGGASAAPSWTTIASGAHTILDATNHTDSVTQTVSRGSLIYGNSTPKWDELVVGGANTFLRTDGTDAAWSTLTIPNAATSTQIAYASGSNALGFTGDVTYDGTDFALNSGKRFRMQSQNRVRYLNSTVQATRTAAQTGLAVNTFTAIAFNATDLFDTDTLHDTASNNSRLTAAIDGKYAVFGSAYLLNSGSAVVPLSSYLRISINGTLHSETGIPYDGGITGNIIAIADLVVLTAGQYVELLADMVATSGTFDVSASINPTFGMVYVGE